MAEQIKSVYKCIFLFSRINFVYFVWPFSGQSSLTNIPISPVLAGLTLAAAILFAIVCIVLAMVYRKQANRLVYNWFWHHFAFDFHIKSFIFAFSFLFWLFRRSVEENLKSNKHTQLPTMAVDCQIEQKQQHTRTTSPQLSSLATSMGNNCTGVNNNDTRHHQIISDQEPPDGDETDPDVIPNQYGKSCSRSFPFSSVNRIFTFHWCEQRQRYRLKIDDESSIQI